MPEVLKQLRNERVVKPRQQGEVVTFSSITMLKPGNWPIAIANGSFRFREDDCSIVYEAKVSSSTALVIPGLLAIAFLGMLSVVTGTALPLAGVPVVILASVIIARHMASSWLEEITRNAELAAGVPQPPKD